MGSSLGVYNAKWELLGTLALPPRTTNRGYLCDAGPLVISGDKAVVGFDCGDMLVIDLPSLKIERRIGGYSMFLSLAVIDGLIVTVSADTSRQPYQARAYELATGKQLGTLPLTGTFLASETSSLAVVDYR